MTDCDRLDDLCNECFDIVSDMLSDHSYLQKQIDSIYRDLFPNRPIDGGPGKKVAIMAMEIMRLRK